MAYFSNSSEGELFNEQCGICKYGEANCPIAFIQIMYNYDAYNNKTARAILDELVKQNGACTVFEMAKRYFEIDFNQLNLFETAK